MSTAKAKTNDPNETITNAIAEACSRIAPNWPLDQFIAVNPWWGHRSQSVETAGATLATLNGANSVMPLSWYREAWQDGRISRASVEAAIKDCGSAKTVESLIEALEARESSGFVMPLLSDCVDQNRDLSHAMSWKEFLTHQTSQHCAAWFDEHQAAWHPGSAKGFYGSWRATMIQDPSVAILMGEHDFGKRAGALPESAVEVAAYVMQKLGLPPEIASSYFTAALGSLNGWAAWCAWRGWQANLDGGEDDSLVQLLAIRLGWEALLDDGERGTQSAHARFARAWEQTTSTVLVNKDQRECNWIWQRALEFSYQQPLAQALAARTELEPSAEQPRIQAVFCIDVRSEVFRRALESADSEIHTRGFAGFFGLPIDYTPLGTGHARPQLPGLLSPAMSVTDSTGDAVEDASIAATRARRLGWSNSWADFQSKPSSAFTFVESSGLLYAGALLGRSLSGFGDAVPAEHGGLSADELSQLHPVLAGDDLGLDAKAALAARVLTLMGLAGGASRLVALVGHGSQSANNAHAAGLDCGACCGQTGEVNSRVLASLLNDTAVREKLPALGISLSDDTRFVAALHNTTTDEVTVFDTPEVRATHGDDLEKFRKSLGLAGDLARMERAPSLGLAPLTTDGTKLYKAMKARANDWAQVRPEWGLANNAAFIVAPRYRTRGLDLEGRSFLHDYDWKADSDGSVLELIMTAPMIVTHWINLQYYASTVDNLRYGSGNKTLHNVVGGRIGVFEGNGGDLRIGLPWQSVSDGEKFVHNPLRLSVCIEAPRSKIETVIKNHELVSQLLDNRWLFLMRIDEEAGLVERYDQGEWIAADATDNSVQQPDSGHQSQPLGLTP